MAIDSFTIRVYALIFNDKNEILIADEFQLGQRMTKFPGGGLEFGEGTLDCLQREAMEEFGQPVEITGHFYTTDFFQKALFYENKQLISLYYIARFPETPRFRISTFPFEHVPDINGSIGFRWCNVKELSADSFTFPIDRVVLRRLRLETLH